MKFKVGDVVTCVKINPTSPPDDEARKLINKTGVVTKLSSNDCEFHYHVFFKDKNKKELFYEEELAPATELAKALYA